MIAEGALADVAIADDDPVAARARLDEAVGLARASWATRTRCPSCSTRWAACCTTSATRHRPRPSTKRSRWPPQTNQQLFRAQAVEGLAAVAVTLGDAVAGAQMLGAADAVRAEIGCPFPPLACHVDREQLVATGQAALGPDQWEAARRRGATMTLEAVLVEADRVGPARRDHLAAHIGRCSSAAPTSSSSCASLGRRPVRRSARSCSWPASRASARRAWPPSSRPRAADDGAVVLHGRCEEEMLVPYQPFVDVLRTTWWRRPSTGCVHAARASELVRLIPELAERMPELPAPRPADAETERFRLFEAVAGLLEAASATAPLLVVLDDLQWADRSALLLLKYLARGRT